MGKRTAFEIGPIGTMDWMKWIGTMCKMVNNLFVFMRPAA